MSSWRERLCGSIVVMPDEEDYFASLEQFVNPNESLSCGGGFFPVNENVANMATNPNFMLPTKAYSVLVLKEDGSAVIYSDDETRAPQEDPDPDVTIKVSDF